jgi:hypothetical protein
MRGWKKVLMRLPRGAQAAADLAYWLSRPVAERLAAVQAVRQQAFGTDANNPADPSYVEPRLQRVCSVVQRRRG